MSPPELCWKLVGVWGDRSCPELLQHVHCRNCPVFAAAGTQLLDRAPSAADIAHATQRVAQPLVQELQQSLSLLIFRVGDQWFALDVQLLEVSPLRPIFHIPHRSNRVLLGQANIRGELLLCASLRGLLNIEENPADRHATQRMVVIRRGRESWALPVDEVAGVHCVAPSDIAPPPAAVAHTAAPVTHGVIRWESQTAGCLDVDALLQVLAGSLP